MELRELVWILVLVWIGSFWGLLTPCCPNYLLVHIHLSNISMPSRLNKNNESLKNCCVVSALFITDWINSPPGKLCYQNLKRNEQDLWNSKQRGRLFKREFSRKRRRGNQTTNTFSHFLILSTFPTRKWRILGIVDLSAYIMFEERGVGMNFDCCLACLRNTGGVVLD